MERPLSNPESFIEEVTEEVRRDRLFLLFRKYGWIAVVVVLGIVGGAAYNEWTKAQAVARAQAFGDGVLDALDLGSPEDRRAGLAAVPATGEQAGVLKLLLASDPVEDKPGALKALEAVAADATLPVSYRDLAVLRRVILSGKDMPAADRKAALESIAIGGRPYRTLALEQLAYLQIEAGEREAAITALRTLAQDQEATPALRSRAGQVIVALGGTLTAEG